VLVIQVLQENSNFILYKKNISTIRLDSFSVDKFFFLLFLHQQSSVIGSIIVVGVFWWPIYGIWCNFIIFNHEKVVGQKDIDD
jgi:hypothetical protein